MKLAIIVVLIKLLLIIKIVNGANEIQETKKKEKNYATKHSILHVQESTWDRKVYYYRHTIAIRDVLKFRGITHCEVFQVQNEIEVEEILKQFPPFSVIPEVGMNEILDVIFSCAEIIDDYVVRTYKYKGNPIYQTNTYLYSNTKWCGAIDIASDYHDIGEYGQEDRCCRALQMCPEFIYDVVPGFTEKRRIYHCLCLDRYRSCLAHLDTSIARDLSYEVDRTHKAGCYRVTDKIPKNRL